MLNKTTSYSSSLKINESPKNISLLVSSPSKEYRQKASRVADILMKINSNDILYDIITRMYSDKIFDELMSSKVNFDLIEKIEKTINEVNRLEEEESKKIKEQKKYNNNIENKNEKYKNLNELKEINNNNEYYNDNKINNLNINNSKNERNKVPIPENFKKIKYSKVNKEMKKKNINKTLLVNDKFRKIKQFSFDNYFKRSGSENLTNRRENNGKFFNNYTSIQGGYFDSSLQNGGESKLSFLNNSVTNCHKTKNFQNLQSPVKDYIENKVNVFI